MNKLLSKKALIVYSFSFFLFLLAGIFQVFDSYLSEFYHVLFALLAHFILIFLAIGWGVSLLLRMVRKDLKLFFLFMDALIVFFLFVRMVKYGLTSSMDTLNRYMWYSYYVPQCFIPPTLLCVALSLERRPLKNYFYLLYLPAILLVLLIYTNDFHNWAFSFYFANEKMNYTHGVVFYLAFAWEFLVTLLALLTLFLKCKVSACRKRIWFPFFCLLFCILFSMTAFLLDVSFFKVPELLCFTCIVLIESAISIGLIPTNLFYAEYFHISECSPFIVDESFNEKYLSKKSTEIDKESIRKASVSPVLITKDIRLSSKRIHGGYVFWKENLSKIHEMNRLLEETNESLHEKNELLAYENKLKEKKLQLEEENKLYSEIERNSQEELNKIQEILSLAKKEEDSLTFQKEMYLACVKMAYLKRRNNLLLISKKASMMNIQEFFFSLQESFTYLSLLNIDCHYDSSIKGEFLSEKVCLLYDFFETCLFSLEDMPSSLFVSLKKEGDTLLFSLEMDGKMDTFPSFSKEFPNASIQKEGDSIYFTLPFSSKEGGRV